MLVYRYVFESIVEKVIVGEIDDDGKVDPYKLTFVYKTGFKDGLNGEDFKAPRKNAKKKNKFIGKDFAELSSNTSNHVNKSCSHSSDATCGVCCQPDSKISIQLEISIFDIKVNNERAVQFRKWAGQAVYV